MRYHLRGYTMGKAAEISPSSGPSPNASAMQRPAGLWIACCSQIGRWPMRHGDAHPVHSAIITKRIKAYQGQPGQCRPGDPPQHPIAVPRLRARSLGSDGPLVRCVDHRHLLVRQLPRPREIPDVADIRRCHLVPPVLRFGPFLFVRVRPCTAGRPASPPP